MVTSSLTPERQRIALEVSAPVAALVDHVSTVTGVSKSQIVLQALLDALPQLLERTDSLVKRHQVLAQAARPGSKR